MIEVFIEGNRVDLGDTKAISQVYQINDLGEPKDRQMNFTYPFTMPLTPRNTMFFEMIGIVGNNSTVPYRKLKGNLVQNGVEVISDGLITVTEISSNQIKASIFSGNTYLFDALGSKKLSDLPFYDLNHGVNPQNFVDSFTNTEGYIYAVSDFGKLKPLEGIEINYQVPSLFVHTVWDKIFTQAGIKYYGDVFELDSFKKKVITMHRGYDSEIDVITNPIDVNAAHYQNTTQFTYNPNFTAPNFSNPTINFEFPAQNAVIPYLSGIGNGEGNIIQVIDEGIYEYSFDLDISVGEFSNFLAVFQILRFDGTGTEVIHVNQLGVITQSTPFSQNISGTITVNPNEQLIFTVTYVFDLLELGTVPTNSITQTVSNFNFKNDPSFTSLNFNSYIGELTQKAFVKDIMQEYGLICQKRRNELAYDFIQIKDLIADRTNTLNWSDKFVGEIKEVFRLDKYAQSNRFAYYYLEDDSLTFADGFFNISNENLPAEKTLIQRPYNAPTRSTEAISLNYVLYTPFWTKERNDDGSIKEYKPFQSKNYLAEVKYINVTIDYFLTNGAIQTFNGQLPVLDFDNLNYQKLLEDNYKELNVVLDSNSVRSVRMMLNEMDVQNLDQFKTIYLKQYASDFYINKLRYTSPEIPSKVDLVKIKRNFTQEESGIPSIDISSFASAPNVFTFPFNWMIVTNYTFNFFGTVDATITATQLTDSIANGGVPTGLTYTDNVTSITGQHNFLMPLPTGDSKGWYEVKIEQGGVVSNLEYVEVDPVVVVPASISHSMYTFDPDITGGVEYLIQFFGFDPTAATFHLQQQDFMTQTNIGSEVQIPLSDFSDMLHNINVPNAGYWKTWVTADDNGQTITSNINGTFFI